MSKKQATEIVLTNRTKVGTILYRILKPSQGKDESTSDVKETVADAVDFFGHRHLKDESLEQDVTNEISKTKLKDGGDEKNKKKRKRKRSMFNKENKMTLPSFHSLLTHLLA